MENKNNKYFYIAVAVLATMYIIFGFYMALTNPYNKPTKSSNAGYREVCIDCESK